MQASHRASAFSDLRTIGRRLALIGAKPLRLALRLLAFRAQVIIGHPLNRNG